MENCPKVAVELIEPESYSYGNQRDENVTVIPAEGLHGVHPLTRKVIKSFAKHAVNSPGRLEVRKACKGNDKASVAVHVRGNFPRRRWTWACSKVVADDYRSMHSLDTASVQLRKLKKFYKVCLHR